MLLRKDALVKQPIVNRTWVLRIVMVLASCGWNDSAAAQGFGLYEQGACAMGRAGAGVAAPCNDGSAMFFNPAGLALLTDLVASAEVTGVAPRGKFTNSTTSLVSAMNDRTIPAPAAYGAMPFGKRVVAGIG